MEDKFNSDSQHGINQVQSTTITFPVFISIIGIISVALAVMLYHLLLIRYCRHRRYMDHHTQSMSHSTVTETETRFAVVGPVSWFGLDERALEFIPVLPYCERALEFFRIDQTDCVVCLGKLERGERVRWLPGCAHSFHVACIDNWLRSRASCPTCRTPVVVPRPLLGKGTGGSGSGIGAGAGGLTRARSGGALRRGVGANTGTDIAKVTVLETKGLSVGLKRSLSVDHSSIVIGDGEGGDRDSSGLSGSRSTEWRPPSLVRSILGYMVQDEDRGVLPY